MARVTGPLFSMDASGSVGKALTYGKWKGRSWCREWFTPQNPRTAKQTNVRTAWTLLVAFWQTLAPAAQATWDDGGDALNMSGFDLYMRRGMDEYVVQITTAVLPTSVTYSGEYPADVWTWA